MANAKSEDGNIQFVLSEGLHQGAVAHRRVRVWRGRLASPRFVARPPFTPETPFIPFAELLSGHIGDIPTMLVQQGLPY